jgi:NADH-quinone oxidoreductase subunit N
LAYSSISHLGYILVAFLAGGQLGVEAVSFYLAAYFITTVGAFGILTNLSDSERDAELLDDFRGLFWRRPWTAASFSAMLLSLAGIPLTAGFVGKFYIVAAGVNGNIWLLVIMLVVNSAIGLYYYIRIIAIMCEKQSAVEQTSAVLRPSVYLISGFSVAALTVVLLWVGIFPERLMTLIRLLLTS